MHFASKYVYDYDGSDEECVSETEYEEGMTLSESDSDEDNKAEAKKDAAVKPAGTAGSSKAKRSSGVFGRLFGGSSRGSSELEPTAPPPPGAPKAKAQKKKSHWRSAPSDNRVTAPDFGRRCRRADTNVVVIKFDQLASPSNMHAGDPVNCSNCKALMSHLSKFSGTEEEKVWHCEYCSRENVVDVEPEEVPKNADVTFMLQPAPTTTASSKAGVDQSLVIFCMDVSGSMCVTTEVPGKVNLRGSERLSNLQSLNEERENQWLPGQSRNVTYISRLQGMQAAVDHQLATMAKDHPDRRVGLVTFNNEVTVIGDGSEPAQVVAGDKLGDHEAILKVAKEVSKPKAIKETRSTLGDSVFELEERGATALGPALLLSVAMAAEVPGSKIIVCTDGMANVGLGSLEESKTDDQALQKASNFYAEVSKLAQDNGVNVSVISMKGTDCKLAELGKVAEQSGGQVNIVDPLKLTQEFGSILADPVIAVNVKATFIVHNRIYIREEDSKEGRQERYVGNVTKESEISFEYGIRPLNSGKKSEQGGKKATKTEGSLPEGATAGPSEPMSGTSDATSGPSGATAEATAADAQLTELPFQLQIQYTDLEGAEALRVITNTMPITRDRQLAEEGMDVAVLGVHTAQQSAKLAMKGKYSKSRLTSLMNQRLVARNSKMKSHSHSREAYKDFVRNVAPMENMLVQMQQQEQNEMGRCYSDVEEDEDQEVVERARRQQCSDSAYIGIYGRAKCNMKSFNPSKKS